MMEKDKLRKADAFSGGIIFLFGIWIILQATEMPMKDSWGGVQNVWFVSPAIFPLFVGVMIALLGGLLIKTAVKTVGFDALGQTCRWLAGSELAGFLKTPKMIRFYAIVILFLTYVYLFVPRVDFFLGSVLFLAAFINMFYLDDDALLKKILVFYSCGALIYVVWFVSGIPVLLEPFLPFPGDWPALVFVITFLLYIWHAVRGDTILREKFRLGLVLSFSAPFLIGPIFKYLLLVPMPFEGIVVAILDAIRYGEF